MNKTRSNLNMQDSRSNLNDMSSPPRSNSVHPNQSSREAVENDTLDRTTQGNGRQFTRQRQKSGSSMGMGSMARRRGRSKSRERMRQSRSQQNIAQTSSLPRPNEDGEEDSQRPVMRRSRSNHSLRSTNQRRQRKSGECSVM